MAIPDTATAKPAQASTSPTHAVTEFGPMSAAKLEREFQFAQSLRDWGVVFMLTVWLQSILTSAIAMKRAGIKHVSKTMASDDAFRRKRIQLMEQDLSSVWRSFIGEFGEGISEHEAHIAEMIILVRNQLAHCHISAGRGFALFLPKPSSRKLIKSLDRLGWIEIPKEGKSNPESLILREGDAKWIEKNKAMILSFAEHTVLRVAKSHGIDEATIL